MLNTLLDLISGILWWSIFITPLITIPLSWKFIKVNKFTRVVIGLIFAIILSGILFILSLEIIFRDGMGPS